MYSIVLYDTTQRGMASRDTRQGVHVLIADVLFVYEISAGVCTRLAVCLEGVTMQHVVTVIGKRQCLPDSD